MARKGVLEPLVLTDAERQELERWKRRPKTEQRLAQRAKIILRCAMGLMNQEVAEELKTRPTTVGKWRQRFLESRLEGLNDEARSGAPRTVSDDQVEMVITKTLESTPSNATHWSTRSMAEATGLSNATVSRVWKAFGLKPHLQHTFKLSEDLFFIEKVRDIVGLYMNPPERAIVFCVDEKSQIQALDRTQPLLPMTPYQVETRTHDYVRKGTTSLFAALNVATGEVIGRCHKRHRHQEFLKFLKHLNSQVAREPGQTLHLILDNYGTHKAPAVRRWFLKHPEYVLHFTPTSSSWLNLIERFFSEITTKRIRRGTFKSVANLESAIRDYLKHHNQNPKPFRWTKTPEHIFRKLEKLQS